MKAWPRLRAQRPVRSVTRTFIFSDVVPALAVYRVSRKRGVNTFSNALGDSFRYRP